MGAVWSRKQHQLQQLLLLLLQLLYAELCARSFGGVPAQAE